VSLKPQHVLVVYKKSRYEIYLQDSEAGRVDSLLEREDKTTLRLLQAHRANTEAINQLRHILFSRGIHAEWFHQPSIAEVERADLVISIGGDGTLLEAARKIKGDTPLLGINSSPATSVGYLCSIHVGQLEEALDALEENTLPVHPLARIEIAINDEILADNALNDVLFAHHVPAAVSRYEMRINNRSERHSSSGIWIATAAGSTAAIHSAGGEILPLSSDLLQFRVRELFRPPESGPFRLCSGFLDPGVSLELVSQMDQASLFLDGYFNKHPIAYGDRISFRLSPRPLVLLGQLRRPFE
jgi:NAD+ kinase